jgi:4-hydroxy-tetrahydrodipicolinate synthase
MAPMPSPFGSILTAMVTPFDERGRVDEEAAVALMHHLIEHGSDGLVVCGTTGEATTLTDEEHLGVIGLAVQEMGGRCSVIAGVGSNDTRHAVTLTERATALGADALLSVNPYYNRPSRRGIVAHYREVVRATDLPILLYNIPQRTGADLPNDLLAELAQLENIVGVKQANPANLAPVDGLFIYAGNDDMLADVLDMGEAGGILTSSHIFGEEMHRMVDEPEHRREIDARLSDVYRDMAIAPAACTVKAALNLIGVPVGTPRLPYVELDESELSVVRALLERHGRVAVANVANAAHSLASLPAANSASPRSTLA